MEFYLNPYLKGRITDDLQGSYLCLRFNDEKGGGLIYNHGYNWTTQSNLVLSTELIT